MAAKVFFYPNAQGVWYYGELEIVDEVLTKKNELPIARGNARGRYDKVNGVDHFTLLSADLSTPFLKSHPITEIAKNDELETYANKAEMQAATDSNINGFFFRVSSGGGVGFDFVTTADGIYFPYITDSGTGLRSRFGWRNGNPVWDVEITVDGFTDNVEDVNWKNVTGDFPG